MVPILSSSKKLNEGRIYILALFGSELEYSTNDLATDITLEGWELVLLGAAKTTLIIPNKGLGGAFLWAPVPDWSPYPLGQYKNCYNLPSLTSCSKWFHNVR